ncbi:PilZ domain-containing protein, partial [Pseudomonas sp. 2822-15]|uniref:PilZ domain-containing protein n=1 Tax=Pseudomonas sp. 2822-15 TaxID=1712677 RepID=UPI001179C9B2
MESKNGEAFLYNISPTGLKLLSHLDLRSGKSEVDVDVCFTLVSEHEVRGRVVWQKSANIGNGKYYYGIELLINEEEKNRIINELKEFI